jgi:sedoheptulose-bisphosphatase
VEHVTSKNAFGKQQNNIDLEADKIIFKHLKNSGVVFAAASEESPEKNILNENGSYFISFDPIDGSSVIDCNFSVGTIYGIWDTIDIEGKTGRSLVGAALAVYGTRTTICIYNAQNGFVEELTLMKIGNREKWMVTQPKIQIASQAKLFSIATKGIYDNPTLWRIYEQYICAGFSLRYSGCAALDVNQIFVKKQGVYVMLNSIAHPSRLSLLYEVCPLAFLIEKAGGSATDGVTAILDLEIKGYAQKVNFIAGSQEDVAYISSELNTEGNVSGKKGSYANLLAVQGQFSM